MEIYPILAENWLSDGGACFGVVPKSIWNKIYPSDENNMVKLTNRCLLIKTEGRNILIDSGFGNKQSSKYYDFHYFFGENNLNDSLLKHGTKPEDITDIIFTHLHDDHVGGAVAFDENRNPELVFKNAMHYVSKSQWDWAVNPNVREGASYFKENFEPILKAGKIKFIKQGDPDLPNIEIRLFNGHTEGQIVPIIHYNGKKIVYCGDFIPTAYNIPLPYVPSFDTRPLLSMQEKEIFLDEALKNDYILFFEHDYYNEACNLQATSKGIKYKDLFKLQEITN